MTATRLTGGVGTALVTPFDSSAAVDQEALRKLVARQSGVDFLVPCGSTGEASTLSLDERREVVRIVAEASRGRVPIVVGASSSDTKTAIETTQALVEAGASHVMHAAPMYNRPPQRGLSAHFRAIADEAARPVVLYNVPGRSACNIAVETTLALAEHPNIVGIKEASGDIGQISSILRHRPDGFLVFSGDDALTLPLIAMGAEGVISVVSNVAPTLMAELVRAARSGDLDAARGLHHALTPLMDFAFIDSNPIPIKEVLAHLGWCGNVVRRPLATLDRAAAAPVAAIVASLGISTEEAA